jgi:hypothetical protein
MEKLARANTSLLQKLRIYGEKMFYNIGSESVLLWLQTAAYTQDSKGHLVSVAADTFCS